MNDVTVRAPASSANLGAGFDVFGMAVGLYAEMGLGAAPDGAQQIDAQHPAHIAFTQMGGTGEVWLRCNIPMARGLGFSGAVRVAGAALAVAADGNAVEDRSDEILKVTAELEGHGDNVAASLFGGLVAYVGGRTIPMRLGPTLAGATFVAWVPDVTTSTNASRQGLPAEISRADAVHNLGVATQFVLAFAHDDPELLNGATSDRLHQAHRLGEVPGAEEALVSGVGAGAWCSWLSGSGPTVGFLADADVAPRVAAALPEHGHTKLLAIDTAGACRL